MKFKEFYKKHTSKNRKRQKRTSSILSFIFSLNPVKSNICSYCKKPFDKRLWCEECDPRNIIEGWTSGDISIDKFIKDTMYDARDNDNCFNNFLEWVPFERLANVEQIGEGGYFKVYSAIWVDGKSTCINKPIDKSFRRVSNLKPLMKVALKKLKAPHDGMPNLFLNKLKLHWNINLKDINNNLKFYGITKDPIAGEFMMITEFADQGNLRDFLKTKFNRFLWKDKIDLLSDLLLNLNHLHKSGYFHKNLHSGNILMIDGCAHISDFALSGSINELDNKVYGVLPFIAPEVLIGEPYTISSDIYSFGVIMAELSSGKPPFYDKCHDLGLVSAICKGLRPKFGFATPKAYRKLALKCMSSNPNKRPTAEEIDNVLKFWYRSILSDQCYKERELFGYKGNEIKAMFKDSDEEIPVISTSYRKNPYAIYISRAFDFTNLLRPIGRSIISYRLSSEKYIRNESKKSKSMYISRSMSNDVLIERKPNPIFNRRSKSSEGLYDRKPNSMYISRPSIDSIYEDESVTSYDSNRPSIESDETTYDGKLISMYINRPSKSVNEEEEVSYVRNIDSLYISRLSANKDEISYHDSSLYINRSPTIKSIHSIDEIDESNSDSTYNNNNLPSTYYNDFSKTTKTTSFSGISYLKDNEEGTIISPFHNIYF